MTQLNGSYPSTAYLTGFLRSVGVDAQQDDLSIRLALRLFSRDGITEIGQVAGLDLSRHASVVDAAVRFLQGRDPSLAYRIVGRELLPEGKRFAILEEFVAEEGADPLAWAFGGLGLTDRARWLATLFLEDLADVVREHVDPRFELVRYGESLAASQPSFDPIADALAAPPTCLDRWLDELVVAALERHRPAFVGVSAPFAGNVYGAFRVARAVRAYDPTIRLALGGGYPSTELRELSEPRVFDLFDAVMLDDGELPFLRWITGGSPVRTFRRVDGVVVYEDDKAAVPPTFDALPAPMWEGIPVGLHLGVLDTLNPMHRVWSDTRWNKLTVAHGCYWKRCTFCDTSLDYIARYEPAAARTLVDRMEAQIAQTGQTGFHLVDEAAPPRALRALSEEILARGLMVTWWGNIRFEKAFTPELCALMAKAGCVAVTGGLEVGHDRVLTLIDKGVTVEQVARVTQAFSGAGVMVHAYLMYGFPTQTVQETVDALECVRQLFTAGCLQSAFWHRFSATAHSAVGQDPARFGIELVPDTHTGPRFARNDLAFVDPTGVDHEVLGEGLRKAVYNYMLGIGLDQDVRGWFPFRAPRSRTRPDRVDRALGLT